MSAEAPGLDLILCWHMHQPEYRDLASGEYRLPWTYLHAVKDYSDMAAHLEAVPEARAVVNFAPVLLDQIEDYRAQLALHLERDAPLRDPLLAALAASAAPRGDRDRLRLIQAGLRANEHRIINRFAPFRRLAELARWALKHPGSVHYLSEQFFFDLLVWYHLGWLGETVRRGDPRVRALMEREQGYGAADRRTLLAVIHDVMAGLVPRYRRLAERGQVELSASPFAHPILPLLLDFASAREALPDAPLPEAPAYPGGEERARWHIEAGIETFRRHFGFAPRGCWPSEGGVSTAALRLLAEAGFQWAASGGSVLAHSLEAAGREAACLHRVWEPAGTGIACFFRDDGLSDLIGFTYADWHADDAVANLVHHLENIAAACAAAGERPVVAIIMDGENAWEHYPENGYHFLGALYRELAAHPRIHLTTFSDHLARHSERHPLPRLVAGSWVYGTFSTWIGEPDKNRGWDLLVAAKSAWDEAVAGGAVPDEAALVQLAACEGSDWFWWFGDYNPAETVSDFERLFRLHLGNLYRRLGRPVPAVLRQPFTRGHGHPALGGVMRPGRPEQ